jgi:hypothetical protein
MAVAFPAKEDGGAVAIKPDPKSTAKEAAQKRRNELQAQLAEATMYSLLGSKVLKLSAKTMKAIGGSMDGLGIQHIGHGRIFLAGETALNSIAACDKTLEELKAREPACDPYAIVGVLKVKNEFARLLLESGVEHIKATKQIASAPPGQNLNVLFPPNSAMAITVGGNQTALKPSD